MANRTLPSFKISYPPDTGNATLDAWNRSVFNVLNTLPFSIFSTSDGPNQSGITSPEGYFGFEVGSSTTKLWLKESGSTSTGWVSISTE